MLDNSCVPILLFQTCTITACHWGGSVATCKINNTQDCMCNWIPFWVYVCSQDPNKEHKINGVAETFFYIGICKSHKIIVGCTAQSKTKL